MKALRAIKWILSRWWLIVLTAIAFLVLDLVLLIHYCKWLEGFASVVTLISLLLLPVSLIYMLFQKRWIAALLLLCSVAPIFYLINIIGLVGISAPDHFADELKLPEHVKIYAPVELDQRAHFMDSVKSAEPTTGLMLYDDFQGGLYQYDFWTDMHLAGKVYLKAFEVTEGIPLSTDRLPAASLTTVASLGDTLALCSTERHFTIYEGDWGKPYAARFEVWLKPSDGSAERKVYEQVYKIEGWQR